MAAFVIVAAAANPLNGLVATTTTAPDFVDMDGDGDFDAVLGRADGTFQYFENTGSATAAVFVERTGGANPLDGMDAGSSTRPTLVDIDNDGDMDLFAADGGTGIVYYENTGNAATPTFTQRVGGANPLDAVASATFVHDGNRTLSLPMVTFADIDNDGDKDALVGETADAMYYENTGNAAAPVFTRRIGASNPFDDNATGYSSISGSEVEFVDYDGDGDMDVFWRSGSASPIYSENTGTVNAPAYTLRTGASNPLNGLGLARWSFVDITGDGVRDLFGRELFGYPNLYRIPLSPVLSGVNNAAFFENSVNATAALVDANVSVSDGDSANFSTGNLTVSYAAGGGVQDQLGSGLIKQIKDARCCDTNG